VGLQLPGELTEPLSWIGLEWPEADEEKLFEAGQQWIAFGARLQEVSEPADKAAAGVWTANEGEAVDAFRAWWTDDDGPATRLAQDAVAATVIGAALVAFAAATLALKIAFIVQLIMLAVAVAQAIAAAVPTLGASTAAVPGFIAAVRLVCQRLVRKVVDQVQTVIRELLENAKKLLKIVPGRRGPRADGSSPRRGDADLPSRELTDADRATLYEYTHDRGYQRLNPFLRRPDKYADEERELLQAQADGVSQALVKLPDRPGTTYRGVDFSDAVLSEYEPGRIVSERAFTSTSRDPLVALEEFEGNTFMTITGRSGKDVTPFSAYSHEAEILFDKGTRFKIIDKVWDPNDGKWLISMREV
jgi:ADP-ribosyltransferase exoenzyme